MSIETSTRCHCGSYVVLSEGSRYHPHGGWDAHCPDCYGPVEDSGPLERVLGWGKTPDEALWDWSDKHEEGTDLWLEPVDLFGELAQQVSKETKRQRGWVIRADVDINHSRSELTYGPVSP